MTPSPLTPSFAERLNDLISRHLNPATGQRWSDAEIASAAGVSKTAIWALRTGAQDNPTRDTIVRLAGVFGVNPGLFFGDQHVDELMADIGVQRIAARAVGLSEDSQRVVLTVLEQIRRLEQPEADR